MAPSGLPHGRKSGRRPRNCLRKFKRAVLTPFRQIPV